MTDVIEGVEDFANRMSVSEDEHLNVFICYIKNSFLDDELRAHDCNGFARTCNGEFYWKNNYDKKLKAAYLEYQ